MPTTKITAPKRNTHAALETLRIAGRDRRRDGAAEDRDQRQPGVRAHELVLVVDDGGHERALGDGLTLREHEHRERERIEQQLVDRARHEQAEDRAAGRGGAMRSRRPPRVRSSSGPSTGATTANGAIVSSEVQQDLAARRRRRRAEEERVGERDRDEDVAAHADRVRERQP